MAKQMIKGLTMLMLVLVLSLVTSVVSANGQSSKRVVANIPFEFTVGNNELPAGTYAVEPATSGSPAMKIVGRENAKSTIRLSSLLQRSTSEKGKLVFHRYANRYFLVEIWSTGEREGRKLNKSNSERAMERELASNAKPSEQRFERIEIAALVRR